MGKTNGVDAYLEIRRRDRVLAKVDEILETMGFDGRDVELYAKAKQSILAGVDFAKLLREKLDPATMTLEQVQDELAQGPKRSVPSSRQRKLWARYECLTAEL